ncbi:hypothetical protein MMAG44476_06936 [Mycolicibacterium mageritense DSM 44476 = CIP 104973]|uniref:TIGR02391 family protein n=1 Tax=Mycolicibacterium mageritense TaxID=53462 RepID=A0ABM7I661_MYCME|nr:hypothetical protein [Mycolicibacterium mageritense]MCC9182200.1 hypothetical protein [Mycolicibacterium mageritense]BBX38439.1 hypothetical protein MMAGJ_77210 [Mycolicibacterium mageritense]CDO26828.1 hypothetical protein BN978_07389 [Mycolicibacterium mageritense DSM 44476 = CIP 104973]
MTTTDDQWAPLELGEEEVEVFTALREDVPDYLYRSLWTWIFDRFSTSGSTQMTRIFNPRLARECERVLKISIADSGPYADESFHAVQNAVRGPDLLTWRLVDFLASQLYRRNGAIDELGKILVQSGAAWDIGDRQGKSGLVRRVPQGVKAAAEAAFQKPNAGKRLAIAWEDAFGVNPNPSKAYWFAVKAVEDASAPVVIPNDPGPTLGKVISRMEQGGQFNLPHLREDPRAATHEVLIGMMRMLWVGQYDRHGGLPQSPLPDDVTQKEAESAVLLAVNLVGWFESGHVQQ